MQEICPIIDSNALHIYFDLRRSFELSELELSKFDCRQKKVFLANISYLTFWQRQYRVVAIYGSIVKGAAKCKTSEFGMQAICRKT